MKANKEIGPNPPWHGIMTGTDINRASNWKRDHTDHVKRLVASVDGDPIYPTGSDVIRPELWKGIHWKWFFQITATHL